MGDSQGLMARMRSAEYPFMLGIAIVIGLLGGLGATVFRLAINLFQYGSFGFFENTLKDHSLHFATEELQFSLEGLIALPWYILLAIPTVGGLIVGPVIFFLARETRGDGVPDVMSSVMLKGGVMRPRTMWATTLASAITIGTGGSVGREGPIIQIGSAIGSTMGQIFKVSARNLRTLVGCGAAAGIAATFNAPIAGSLFAVEVILGDFGVSQFSPIVISSVIATVVSRSMLGDYPAFEVPPYHLESPLELIPYMILGMICGLVAVLFIRTLFKTEDLFEKLPLPPFLKPALGGLMLGCLVVALPRVLPPGYETAGPRLLGVGYETVGAVLTENPGWVLMLVLIGAKLLATSFTLGSGGSGGIFSPSLFFGAMTGGLFGTVVHGLFPESTAGPGAYALVGMGALVAGTIHAPLTAMIIIFEITGTYQIIPPLMAACVISTLLSMRLNNKTSIYAMKLIRQGLDLSVSKEINVLKGITVTSVLRPLSESGVVPETMGMEELLNRLVSSRHTQFFVTNSQGKYCGSISFEELRRILLEKDVLKDVVIASDMIEPEFPTLTTEDGLDLAMNLLTRENIEEIPVVSAEDPSQLIGHIHKRDVIDAHNREILKRDLSGGLATMLPWVEKSKTIPLGEGFTMTEVEVPSHFIGKSLRELNIRVVYGVEVVLLKKGPSTKGHQASTQAPHPDYQLESGDILLVLGEEEKVRRFTER